MWWWGDGSCGRGEAEGGAAVVVVRGVMRVGKGDGGVLDEMYTLSLKPLVGCAEVVGGGVRSRGLGQT